MRHCKATEGIFYIFIELTRTKHPDEVVGIASISAPAHPFILFSNAEEWLIYRHRIEKPSLGKPLNGRIEGVQGRKQFVDKPAFNQFLSGNRIKHTGCNTGGSIRARSIKSCNAIIFFKRTNGDSSAGQPKADNNQIQGRSSFHRAKNETNNCGRAKKAAIFERKIV